MLEEFREFCEDNNLAPPAPLESVPASRRLIEWFPGDPALESETPPALRLRSGSRSVVLQRVIYEIRYALAHELEREAFEEEIGSVNSVATAFEVARLWLGGAGFRELPASRRAII
jgi:hypothetical protein